MRFFNLSKESGVVTVMDFGSSTSACRVAVELRRHRYHSPVEICLNKSSSKAKAEEWKKLASNKRDDIRGTEHFFCNIKTLPSNFTRATTSQCRVSS
ncbi:unnamed protein product [Alternaria burnsii]|nr:unnamed protein product [Alternaria burnsii]